MNVEITDQILDTIKEMPPMCDHCLGRQLALIGHGMRNDERGKEMREKLGMKEIPCEDCWLCEGLFNEIARFSDLVMEAIDQYEFDTYLIGSRIEKSILDKERELNSKFGESIKREINREIGKEVGKKIEKEVDFKFPDITAIVDTQFDVVELKVRSLYIYGRYWKFSRGIPQTRWWCKKCRGLGCEYCNWKGKMYESSVEEMIASKIMDETKGNGEAFHGAGREDIDARMLGNGRPFIIEIKEPRKRNIDLSKIEHEINNGKDIKIAKIRFSNKKEIEKIKSARWKKTYRIKITAKEEINEGKLNRVVDALRGKVISQRTPSRVRYRRPDKIRKRKVFDIEIEKMEGKEAVIVATTEAGTYVKELVNGDNGGTKPSISSELGTKCEMEELDVIGIHDLDGDLNEEVQR